MPDGAPAQLLEFIREHPGAKIGDAMLALNLTDSTAYYALTRLRDLRLVKRRGRWSPARWQVVGKPPADPACLEERHAELTASAPMTLHARSVDAATHPTGTLSERAGGVQVFGISGPQVSAPEYSHQGTVNVPGAAHPWSWGNYGKSR